MLPPSPVRRLVLVPLVVAIAGALAVLALPLALLSAAFNLVRHRLRKEDGVGAGRRHRMRALRVVCFALVWAVAETAALTVMLCLWIVSGFGGRLDTEPYQTRHYGIMRWLLDLIYRTAERTCGLNVTVTGPTGRAGEPPRHRAEPPRGPGRLPAARALPDQPLRPSSPHRHEGDAAARPHRGRAGQPAAERVHPQEARRHKSPHRPDQPPGRQPRPTRRPAHLSRRRQLDPAALAPRDRQAAPRPPRRPGRTCRRDAQRPPAAPGRGIRGDRRLPGR